MTLRALVVPLSVLAGTLACTAAASTDDSRPPSETSETADPAPTLDAAFLREHTRILSDDALAGRRPGSEGGAAAVAHIVETMQSLGLEPAGEDGGWTQAVPMRAVSLDAEATGLELVGPAGARPLSFGDDWVGTSFAAEAQAIDAELVFVGYGVTAPEYEWDDYAAADVRGKIVLTLVGDPPVSDGRFAGPAMTYYGRWTYKFERARAAGAIGCLVIHDTEAASYGWNVPQTSYAGERFQVLAGDGAVPEALAVQGWLASGAAEAIAKEAVAKEWGTSLEDWVARALTPDFKAVATGLRLKGQLATRERRLSDVNVLGRRPGRARAHESLVISAHWDHLGSDAALIEQGQDGIYNGAIDNASGIAGMLGVAAALRGEALDRSIVLLATTAEEQGLLGSRYWVANPTMPLEEVVAVVNIDSMNVYGATQSVEVIGWGQSTLEDRLVAAAETQGRSVIPDSRPEAGGFYRSDHFPFALAGIPALYFRSGFDMVDGGEQAGAAIAKQIGARYHTPADEFDPSWSFAGALLDTQLVVALLRELANTQERPSYKPGSEFAGKR